MTSTVPSHRPSRRALLGLGAGTFLGMTPLAGCETLSTAPAEPARAGDDPASGDSREAPMLAERVSAGSLPALSERLPDNPVAVTPAERSGRYGGTWRQVVDSADADLSGVIGYTSLLRWDTAWQNIVPDVAEAVEVDEGGAVFTFRLRKGMKWSDGKPFSADDIVFTMNDVMVNLELFPAPSSRLIAGGEVGHAEKVDEHTVKIVFAAPNGQFLMSLAALKLAFTANPFHYMKQFHKKYNPEVASLAEEAGFSTWTELYTSKGGDFGSTETYWQNPDMPTLNPWMVTRPLAAGSTLVAERNPYYWKVNDQGRQLPYLDKVEFSLVTSPEVMLLNAQNGEIDMQARYFNTLTNKPALARSRQKGGYDFLDVTEASSNTALVVLNLTHKDETMRQIFQNKDFRIGLSHAINRDEIIDVVYAGVATPSQAAPRPDSPLYDEGLAKQYTDYDENKANEHLDRAGYTERDGNGIRLGPDGSPISFRLAFTTTYPQDAEVATLIEGYWRSVGIDVSLKPEGPSLFYERIDANEIDAVIDGYTEGMLYDVLLEPNPYFPFGSSSFYALPWGVWYTSTGKDGLEPPEAAKSQMSLYDQIVETVDTGEQTSLMKEILRIAKEEFWQMGIALPTKGYAYGIVKNNFRNEPKNLITSSLYCDPGPTYPEQYFMAGQ